MKKLKILPTVLMLVLCVGVLAVGVFAITPTKNTISGSITINMANEPIIIKCYLDEVKPENLKAEFNEVRAGIEWTEGIQNLSFDTSSANTIEQVPNRILIMQITNPTNKKLIAYFTSGDSLIVSDTLKSQNNINVADVSLKELTILNPNSTIEMTITLKACTFITGDGVETAGINYGLTVDLYSESDISNGKNTTDKIVTIPVPAQNATEEQKTISARAFENNKNIEAVIIPEGITTIKSSAFSGCSNLSTISLPSTLTTVEIGAFTGCVFESVNCDLSGTGYKLENGTLKVVQMHTTTEDDYIYPEWQNVKNLILNVDFSLAQEFDTIGTFAFTNCSSLKYVEIPDYVKVIGGGGTMTDYSGAFSNCENLKYVKFGKNLTSIWNWAFYYSGLENIEITAPKVRIYDYAFSHLNLKTAIIYGEYLSSEVFSYSSVETLNLGCKTITLGGDMWSTTINNINFLEGAESITMYSYLFEDLEFIKLPSTTKLFEVTGWDIYYTSSKWTALKAIYIPKSVTSIANATFTGAFTGGIDNSGNFTTISEGPKIFVENGTNISSWGTWDKIFDVEAFDEYGNYKGVVAGYLTKYSNYNDYLITNATLSDYEEYVKSIN